MTMLIQTFIAGVNTNPIGPGYVARKDVHRSGRKLGNDPRKRRNECIAASV